MHTTNLRKVGGSVMLVIPPAILDLLHLHAGTTVGLAIDQGCLVVEPTSQPRYRLDKLLAQCDAMAAISAEDRTWLDGKPIGLRGFFWKDGVAVRTTVGGSGEMSCGASFSAGCGDYTDRRSV